ncbi:MAG: hypothetical protein Q9220_000861 [cf. Caloplaca sp. 1 TL-2023]
MAAFPPLVAPSSTDDPMELYQDLRNQETNDDSIDIDLDLRENIEDDEMIEDPESEVDSALQTNNTLVHDEQMMDDAAEEAEKVPHTLSSNILRANDEDLEDVDASEPEPEPEPEDDHDLVVEINGSLVPSAETNDDFLLLDSTQINAQGYTHTTGDNEFTNGSSWDRLHQRETAMSQGSVHTGLIATSSSILSVPDPPHTVDTGQVNGVRPQSSLPSADDAARSSNLLDERTITPATQLQRTSPQVSPQKSPGLSDGDTREAAQNKNSKIIEKIATDDGLTSNLSYQSMELPDTVIESNRPVIADLPLSPPNIIQDANAVTDIVTEQIPKNPDAPLIPESDQLLIDEASSEALYVHPVVVAYQDSEMCLFPPAEEDQDHSQTYLLPDEVMATDVIQVIFKGCRDVLEDSISGEDELVINVDDLGLRICELHYHDGNESPPAMRVTLSTQTWFSSRLDYLINFIAEGKGFSKLNDKVPETDRQDYTFSDVEALTASSAESADINEATVPTDTTERSVYTEDTVAELQAQSPNDIDVSHKDRVERLSSPESGLPEDFHQQERPNMMHEKSQTDTSDRLSTNAPPEILGQVHPEDKSNEVTQQEPEGVYEEQYDEDFLNNEEVDQDSGEYSPGSSTVQGDEAGNIQDNEIHLDELVASNIGYTLPAESNLKSLEDPQTEDLDSYGHDELGDYTNIDDFQDATQFDAEVEHEPTSGKVAALKSTVYSKGHALSRHGSTPDGQHEADIFNDQAEGTTGPKHVAAEYRRLDASKQRYDNKELVEHGMNADPAPIPPEGQDSHTTDTSRDDVQMTAPEGLINEEDEITFEDDSDGDNESEGKPMMNVVKTTTSTSMGKNFEPSAITSKRGRTDEDLEAADDAKSE